MSLTKEHIDGHDHPRVNNQMKSSAKGRFTKGMSGNPAGRPKGRPNFATALKHAFHENIRVTKDGKTMHLPTYRAIVEVLQRDALKGENRAMHALHEIMDMTGLTKQVTDEERVRRLIRLPNPFSRDEFDLMLSKAREKDRQRCRVALADKTLPASTEQILETCGRAIARSKQELKKNANDKQALEELTINIARIGLLADERLFAGDFAGAVRCADAAIIHAPLPPTPPRPTNPNMACPTIRDPDPDLVWIHLIRAHARMLDGHVAEARNFYLRFQTNPNELWTSWETVILQDFRRLKKFGHQNLLVNEIEQRFTQLGWTTTPGPPRKSTTQMLAALAAPGQITGPPRSVIHDTNHTTGHTVQSAIKTDSSILLTKADDVESGNRLLEQGKLKEALAVYHRHLQTWKLKCARNQINTTLIANSVTAAERIGDIALVFIQNGEHQAARDAAEGALSVRSNTRASLCFAHALMFLGHENQARELYVKCREQRLDAERNGQEVMLRDFAAIRAAGLTHRLMDEMENQLTTPERRNMKRLER